MCVLLRKKERSNEGNKVLSVVTIKSSERNQHGAVITEIFSFMMKTQQGCAVRIKSKSKTNYNKYLWHTTQIFWVDTEEK